MKRIKGKITHWNRRKAYGFITPDRETNEVFVHISEFKDRREIPSLEQVVEFSLSTDKQGRPCAVEVARYEQGGGDQVKTRSWIIGAVVVIVLAGAAALFFLP